MLTLHSSCSMSGTSYPLGDLLPDGTPKTGDSANFGLFKNNCEDLDLVVSLSFGWD